MTGFYVAIEGPTGVGKTTLAKRLAAALDAEVVYDPFDANPFLAQLLTCTTPNAALALRVELTFFALRVAQLRQIASTLGADRNVVADWALFKQPIFAATTVGPADAVLVTSTVTVWAGTLPAPDVLIGLHAGESTLRQRVRQRGRAMEAGLTGTELAELNTAFRAAYDDWTGPLICLDAASFNTFDPAHVTELATQVRRFLISEMEMR